ncbi:DinB family protein [Jiangella alba]|uniref:Pentapeptide repeat-containing protein n=1 Tax=Jiangella alba TaxID=561176 RepID=A0A1H5GMR8_9ACTN|nr:DinB family protein [Jiangella alba]SEE17076.1 Pentapeptide repeat-containing protein [Jiangella alba]
MPDFDGDDLSGSRFRRVDLSGARFQDVDLSRAVLRGVELNNADISGDITGLTLNGVDVAPLVEAELDRRDPYRLLLRPSDADGCRAAYELLVRRWDGTIARARRLDPALLHESVDGEWSFIETLRHLVFVTDSWVRRAILGEPAPWHPLALPWDGMPDLPGVPRDRAARPSLDTVVDLVRDRRATVRSLLGGLTDATFAADTVAPDGPGWPPARSFPVGDCLRVLFDEEYQHRLYAERDLAVLEAR